MRPKKLKTFWRLLDYLMIPLMYVISGTFTEKPQESHVWHGQNLDQNLLDSLDPEDVVIVQGEEPPHKEHGGVAFHVPVIGGWKNYVVLEVQGEAEKWNVGWIVRKHNSVTRFQIHKLPIFDRQIRLLSGTTDYVITFFAVDEKGTQLPLQFVDKGKIGDGKYSQVRLF